MGVNFLPTRGDFTELRPFRYWCQKVLPLVYDDSLSYYELLGKVVDLLNKSMEDIETLNGDVTAMYTAYGQLQSYVNDYFDNLDVQNEINNKLDAMASSGALTQLISPLIPSIVTGWLDNHVVPTSPVVDNTLNIRGAAADSFVTGKAVAMSQPIISGVFAKLFFSGDSFVVDNSAHTISLASNVFVYKNNFQMVATSGSSCSLNESSYVFIRMLNGIYADLYTCTPYEYSSVLTNEELNNLIYLVGRTDSSRNFYFNVDIDHDVRIENLENASRLFVVGQNDNVASVITQAMLYPNAVVYIEPYEHDCIAEWESYYGSTYFSGMGSGHGLDLVNGVRIIGASGSKLKCWYTGSNDYVMEWFSLFNNGTGGSGYTLENLTLDCKKIRYCVHDERGGDTVPYKTRISRCNMSLDNSASTWQNSRACLGGGLGVHGDVVVEDSVFKTVTSAENMDSLAYHNSAAAGAKSNLVIKGCYCAGDSTIQLAAYGDSTLKTPVLVLGCSVGSDFEIYDWSGNANFDVMLVGNVVRTEPTVNDLKATLNANLENLMSGNLEVNGVFVRKSLYHGALANNYDYRIATQDVHSYSEDVVFNVKDGFKYLFNFLLDDGTTFDVASSWLTGEYIVDKNRKWRMMIARVTEDTSEVADIELFKSQVYVGTYIKNATDENSEEIKNVKDIVDVTVNPIIQYIDTNQFVTDKYWYNSSGNISMSSSSGGTYHAYPELNLSAGTYYINYTPGNFSFVKGKTTGTVSNYSDCVSNGNLILEEDSSVYLTVYTGGSQSLDTVMLSNGRLPVTYKYGVYSVEPLFPTVASLGNANNARAIHVVGENAEFKTIQSACNAAENDDIIFVLPGIYTEQISIFGKKLHIIGFDKKLCTIIDHHANYDTPPVEMNIGTLANFTIIEDDAQADPDLPVGKDHLAYCIHNDSSANVTGQTLEIVNCDMINEIHACIGFGLYQNYTVTIRNCNMRSNAVKDTLYKRGALYFHGNSGADVTGQKIIIENCIASSADTIAVYAGMPGTGTSEMVCRMTGNQLWSDINGTTNDAATVSESASFILDSGSTGNSIAKLNNLTPTQGSKNSVTVSASASATVNNRRNRISVGGVYQFCVVSEDRTSYSVGFIKLDNDGVLVIEQEHALCNVSFSTANGELRVWNRDSANKHVYTVSVKPF